MRYLKMLGIVLVCFAVPLGLDLMMVKLIQNWPLIADPAKTTPTIFFGVFDPINILVLFLFARFVMKVKPFAHMNFKPIGLSNGVVSALTGISLAIFSWSLINLEYIKTNLPQLNGSIWFIISGNIFLLLYIIALNSIYKEVCFRGLIFNAFSKGFPVWLALILQGCAYGGQLILQTDWAVTLYGFLGAYIFGMIYYFGRSIWSSIIAQFCCTMSLVLISKTPLKDFFTDQSGMIIMPLCFIAVIFLILSLYQNGKKQSAQGVVSI